MKSKLGFVGLLSFLAIIPSIASAGMNTAMVESISSGSANIKALDYLEINQSIDLLDNQTITISYMYSCTRETITGGRVIIKNAKSVVIGGSVKRTVTKCNGNQPIITNNQLAEGSVTVFRGRK